MTDHIPLVLKYDSWPQIDQVAWNDLFQSGGPFDDIGPCAKWSEGSRQKRRQSYGQWLSFLLRTDAAALGEAPARRIKKARVKAFVAECEVRLSPSTVRTLVTDLYVLAKAMYPKRDWEWLNTATKRLAQKANRDSLPAPYPIEGGRILRWSLGLMEETALNMRLSPKKQAIRYRQALMIGFLISCPVRRRALLAMNVSNHVQPISDGFMLHFTAADMKDHKARSFRLPTVLIEPMRAYLDHYRSVLVSGGESQSLWINQYGHRITKDGYSRELPKITQRYLGVPLRPHAFRHIVATTIAERDPDNVNIIRDVLGHATLDMAQKHYNRATGISSCNALQSLVDDIRKSVPMIGKATIQLNPRD
jgi:integrase